MKAVLVYDKGTIVIKGDVATPYGSWDPRVNAFRALGLHYWKIREYLVDSKVDFVDDVLDLMPCPELKSKVELRSYQNEALDAWTITGKRGVIVLPTGAGKTVIAVKAISEINQPTLVVVPTLDLLDQWNRILAEQLKEKVGVYGGGEHTVQALTISTYDSAYLRADELGNRFMFVIFDEVHHLPAAGYRQIAEMFVSPYRMGLTATYEREDGLHTDLPFLVGGKVFEMGVDDLAGEHLAPYSLHRISVELTPEEKREYDIQYKVFKDYLKRKRISLRGPEDFRRFIMKTGLDSEARRALLARNRALNIALNSFSKIDALRNLLANNPKERILIFTQHNELVHRIAREFLIPPITHKTAKEERSETLDRFRTGKYRRIITSKVLDEGVDVPDATMAIILSGTGSSREFIQRLGRVLRKKEGKKARLVELVSEETTETRISQRRKRHR